ncbi:hypothetical protein FGE12_06495 [Aggregicoccus sp. 17bor-14]|uniref:FxLYD domain-containing protein n=1 Tax=Myxococcaceae TaxID=31 RepID=UPI00129CE17A|nr:MULTISPECIES: FxLYD domain-containing protein [Myxococcaceae]MBF5042037.1 hypothetical protein [Simulacricoccus sp. 17bor-14]MRI87816.1 hypothetical protein [Aggregicoccus sp. 17bor-14]
MMLERTWVRLLAAAACFVFAGSAWAQAARTPVPLPELPSREALHPEVYDADGCLKAVRPGEGRKCGAPPSRAARAAAPRVPTALRGYEGPGYAAEVSGAGVVLVPDSLTVRDFGTGGWSALGLVRNDTAAAVGVATVQAELVGADGAVLDTLSAQAPVSLLRPGEPAPFSLESGVPATSVAQVRWSVRAEAPLPGATRDYLVQAGWELPQGAPSFRGEPRQDAPYPYVQSVGFRALGTPASSVTLAVAWLDKGRVVALVTEPAPEDVDTTYEEASAQFAPVTVSGPDAASLHTLSRIYWVSGK